MPRRSSRRRDDAAVRTLTRVAALVDPDGAVDETLGHGDVRDQHHGLVGADRAEQIGEQRIGCLRGRRPPSARRARAPGSRAAAPARARCAAPDRPRRGRRARRPARRARRASRSQAPSPTRSSAASSSASVAVSLREQQVLADVLVEQHRPLLAQADGEPHVVGREVVHGAPADRRSRRPSRGSGPGRARAWTCRRRSSR